MKIHSLLFILIIFTSNLIIAQAKKTKQKLLVYESDVHFWDHDFKSKMVYKDSLIEYQFEIDTNIIIGNRYYRHFIDLDTVTNKEKNHLLTLKTKNRIVYKEGKLYGIKNTKGKIIEEPKFDVFYKSKQDFFYARDNHTNYWGLYDNNLNAITKCDYYDVFCPNFKKGCFVSIGKYWGSIAPNGKLQIPIYYESVRFTPEGLLIGENSDCREVLSINNDTLLSKEKGCLEKQYENHNKSEFIYKKNKKFGVIDNTGKNILELKYDRILIVHTKSENKRYLAYLVMVDDKWSLLYENKEIFSSLEFIKNIAGYYPLKLNFYKKNGFIGIIKNDSRDGLIITSAIYSDIREIKPITSNRFEDFNDYYKSCSYSGNDRVINNYLYAKKDSLWGIITKKGKAITKFEYEEIYYHNRKGFIARKNKKWGLLDSYGKQKSNFTWEKLGEKIIGTKYITIKENDFIGLIDNEANIVLEPKYQEITKLKTKTKNTFIKIKYRNKWGVFNLDKTYKLKPNQSIKKAETQVLNIYNNTFSVISKLNGIVVFDFKYDSIEIVSTNKHPFIKVKKDNFWKLYNIKQKKTSKENYFKIYSNNNSILGQRQDNKFGTLYTGSSQNINFIYDYIAELPLNKSKFYKIKLNGKYGLIDRKNNFKLNCKYDDIVCLNTNGFYKVKEKNKWKLLKLNDKELKTNSTSYSSISHLVNNYFKVKVNNKYGIINENDSLLLDNKFDDLLYIPNKIKVKKIFTIKKKNKWKLISIKKNNKHEYSNNGKWYSVKSQQEFILDTVVINPEINNYLIAGVNGKVGLIDLYTHFNLVLDYKFWDLKFINKERNGVYIYEYKLKNNSKYKLLKIKEEKSRKRSYYFSWSKYKYYKINNIPNIEFDTIIKSGNKIDFILINNNKMGIYNNKNYLFLEPKYINIQILKNRYLGYTDDKLCESISKEGEISKVEIDSLSKKEKLFSGIYKQRKGCYYGLVDKNNNIILDYKYTLVGRFNKKSAYYPFNMAKIERFNKKGYVLENGKVLVEPVYDILKAYQEGVARVKKDGKWGFIDTKGNVVIELTYDYVEAFKYGKSKVTFKNKTFYIDKNNNIIK